MFNRYKEKTLQRKRSGGTLLLQASAVCLALMAASLPVWAQDQPSQTPATQTPDTGKPKQDAPAEAGGPGDNVGPYAIPKK